MIPANLPLKLPEENCPMKKNVVENFQFFQGGKIFRLKTLRSGFLASEILLRRFRNVFISN